MCIETLDDVEIDACGICYRENDAKSHCSTVQCSECDTWFRSSCFALDKENVDFICQTCTDAS